MNTYLSDMKRLFTDWKTIPPFERVDIIVDLALLVALIASIGVALYLISSE